MEEEIKKDQNIYQCKECLLHYKDRETALQCEAWCKEHKTCNVEITRNSEENRRSSSAKASTVNKSSVDKSEDELSELKKKSQEYLNNWKRAQADFENYKKNEFERVSMIVKYAKEDTVLNLLPILDNIYLAEKHSNILKNVGMSEWLKGFEQIKKQVEEFLKKEGIEEIKTEGEKFNPETMEAIEEVPASADLSAEASAQAGAMAGAVAEELQKGYMSEGKVLRPAKVKITK